MLVPFSHVQVLWVMQADRAVCLLAVRSSLRQSKLLYAPQAHIQALWVTQADGAVCALAAGEPQRAHQLQYA